MLSYNDDETKRLLDLAGHDTPVHWRDNQSGVMFVDSAWDVINALDTVNDDLLDDETAVLETFYTSLDMQFIEMSHCKFNKNQDCGWTFGCFTAEEGPKLYLRVGHSCENGEIIFNFNFNQPYCDDYVIGCDSCDKCLFGMYGTT